MNAMFMHVISSIGGSCRSTIASGGAEALGPERSGGTSGGAERGADEEGEEGE